MSSGTSALALSGGVHVAVGDINGDGLEDVFIGREGEYHIRASAAQAGLPMREMTFFVPPLFLSPDTVKVADLDQDGFADVLVASRQANRLLVFYGQAVLTDPFRTTEFSLPGGPVGADAAQFIPGGPLEILSVLNALPEPNLTLLNVAGEPIEAFPLSSETGGWTSMDVAVAQLLPENPSLQFAWLARSSNVSRSGKIMLNDFHFQIQIGKVVVSETQLANLSAMDVDTGRAGLVTPSLAAGFLLGGGQPGHWVVLPKNANFLEIIPANIPPSSDPLVHREALGFVGDGGAVLTDASGDLIVVTAADGTFARLFRWQGPGNLVVVETIPAPENQSLLHALPLSDGNLFMALRGGGASLESWTAFAHYNRTGAVRGYTYAEPLPAKQGHNAVARVMVFDRDPFGGDALEWESFSLGGWALDAIVQGGNVLVDFQTDPGVPGGLGELMTTSLTPRRPLPSSAVALANQWEPDSSVFFGVAPMLAGGAGVSPQPPPGGYNSPVNLSFAAAQNVTVNFRLGNGNWQTGRGPVEIAQSMTVEFYGVTTDGHAGPIGMAHYAIGEPAGSLPGSLRQDSDQNGLDDAWERLFFGRLGVDPNGDSDGDQFTNREEYQAGTNPRDALSRPPGQPGSTRRIVASLNPEGRFRFRLAADAGTELVPEYSEDLRDWFPLPGTPQILPDGSREWTDPDPPTGARFYRFSSP